MNTRMFLLVFSLSLCGCALVPMRMDGRIRAPVRRSPAIIERFLTVHTPLGSSSSNVAVFINQELNHDGGYAPMFCEPKNSKGCGYPAQAYILATGETVSPDWLPEAYYKTMPDLKPVLAKPWKGDTAKVSVILGMYMGIPFQILVIGEWTFDRKDRLIDISVKKEEDAL